MTLVEQDYGEVTFDLRWHIDGSRYGWPRRRGRKADARSEDSHIDLLVWDTTREMGAA
jgi:hypothetical protein